MCVRACASVYKGRERKGRGLRLPIGEKKRVLGMIGASVRRVSSFDSPNYSSLNRYPDFLSIAAFSF